jgi:hypothetical protein
LKPSSAELRRARDLDDLVSYPVRHCWRVIDVAVVNWLQVAALVPLRRSLLAAGVPVLYVRLIRLNEGNLQRADARRVVIVRCFVAGDVGHPARAVPAVNRRVAVGIETNHADHLAALVQAADDGPLVVDTAPE